MICLMKFQKRFAAFLLILTLALGVITISPQSALADATANPATAAEVFSVNCAGCHSNGGNIIRRGKNLKQKALKKYKMDSIANIANLVTNGKNIMPSYKARLSEQQIIDVSAYVLSQAESDWK
ncbi:MAG: cytochrome C6 [Oscillatoriales cyanobacterium]|nr:MAG: cytochrome C6 [Oscillatoriales cyanobacterium]TAD96858.1 MAG: cytochrome C6 [Oscillatoriales cyanobacterium]TAD97479.1 MAG: cytochrome C6 [Oscillatoriales cyanobacterium]TAE97178.1 MAG: cytochrome C6 [Oscillatoriales cyanobacterium]TAF40456.1 MAG: cytochrome C6 [Oscillatoriales cyanobacterium]